MDKETIEMYLKKAKVMLSCVDCNSVTTHRFEYGKPKLSIICQGCGGSYYTIHPRDFINFYAKGKISLDELNLSIENIFLKN